MKRTLRSSVRPSTSPARGGEGEPSAATGAAAALWRGRDVRLVLVGRAVPFLGDEIAVVGLTLWAYAAGWGTRGVAWMLAAAAAPLALGAPLAGRVVDRVDSRLVTVIAATWQAACALALAAVVGGGSGRGALAGVIALLVLLNAGQAVAGPAWQALVPHTVPEAEVGRMVSLAQSALTLAGIAGPALGGVLVGAGGVVLALLLDAACLSAVAVAALAVGVRRRPAVEPAATRTAGGPAGDAWAGVRQLRSDPVLGPLVLGLFAVALFVHSVTVVEVFLVRGTLGAGPRGYGVVMAVAAATALVGSLAAGRIRLSSRRARDAVAALLAISAAVLLGGMAPVLAVFALAMAVLGLGQGVLNVSLQTLLLERTPDRVRGRVAAAVAGGVQACTLGGMLLGGVAGGLLGPRPVFVLAGVAGCLASATAAVRLRGRPALTGSVPATSGPATDLG